MYPSAFMLVVVVLSCSGCAGSTAIDERAQATTAASATWQDLQEVRFGSPLATFLGFESSGVDDVQSMIQQVQRTAEELTARCMIAAGFEYVPANPGPITTGPGGGDLPYFSSEWIEKYGFGVTTLHFDQAAVADLVGRPAEETVVVGSTGTTNESYVASLSASERDAYDEALLGTPPDFDSAEPYQPNGCQFEAFAEASSDGPGGGLVFYDTFGAEIDDMRTRVRSDPRALAFNAGVSACVAEAGEQWQGEDALGLRFDSRLASIRLSADGRLGSPELETLAALQAEEVSLARLVVECGGGPIAQGLFEAEIRHEYENEFLEKNSSALAEFSATN